MILDADAPDWESKKAQQAEAKKWIDLGYRVEEPYACINLSSGERCVYSLLVFMSKGVCNETPTEIQIDWRKKNYIGIVAYAKSRVFTGFFRKLVKHQKELDEIFENDVKYMYDNLEGFGKDCALDGKLLDSYAKKENKKASNKKKDNRRDNEASWTCKTYNFKDGTSKSIWHFGYEAHILGDATYGLPIWKTLETASVSEQKVCDEMIEDLNNNHKYILEKMENFLADAGYDNGSRNKLLKDIYNINPLVDIRHMWKEEKIKEIDNKPLAYNEDGEVFYIKNIKIGEYEKLKYLGYDKQRKCLRYGFKYKQKDKVFRIPINIDRRIFLPIARDSEKYKRIYKKRTKIERLNGRIDRDYMFNDHFIRGKEKMNMMLTLSFIVMLTMAKGHIKNKKENIRSLIN